MMKKDASADLAKPVRTRGLSGGRRTSASESFPLTTIVELLFEMSRPGREGVSLSPPDDNEAAALKTIPRELLRTNPAGLPEVSEPEVVRHFTRLSQLNFSIDTHFYPLGSCTMKYNPRITEELVRLPGFAAVHPQQDETTIQGCLALQYQLEQSLNAISGMDHVTLQPAAGAHGELTGLLMIRAYHERLRKPRGIVLIPDSAHGTNPASAAMAGYKVIKLTTGRDGTLSVEMVLQHLSEDVAALMMTNPNTLGLFEKDIRKIADRLHAVGALLYCDGANLNALMGRARLGDMGVDLIQFNLHKTFTTPHGGGGPGAGPVGVKKILEPFLPRPVVHRDGDKFRLDFDRPDSIGRVRAGTGNFAMLVRAYAYIREMGAAGLRRATDMAVLNANYVRKKLEPYFDLPYNQASLHEAVFTDKRQRGQHVATLDIAKRLMDYGFHPPTVYFPLLVEGALMIEPTETETRETLDKFCEAMIAIAREAAESPDTVKHAPSLTPFSRLDEVKAARELNLRWTQKKS